MGLLGLSVKNCHYGVNQICYNIIRPKFRPKKGGESQFHDHFDDSMTELTVRSMKLHLAAHIL
jgi:hypothetical protein